MEISLATPTRCTIESDLLKTNGALEEGGGSAFESR